MTDKIPISLVDVHPSNATLTLFVVGNCFLIASIVREYSLQQILLRVLPDGSIELWHTALNVCCNSRLVIAFHGMSIVTNPSIKLRFQVAWLNSRVVKSLSAIFVHSIC
jgi:hypothetical protein